MRITLSEKTNSCPLIALHGPTAHQCIRGCRVVSLMRNSVRHSGTVHLSDPTPNMKDASSSWKLPCFSRLPGLYSTPTVAFSIVPSGLPTRETTGLPTLDESHHPSLSSSYQMTTSSVRCVLVALLFSPWLVLLMSGCGSSPNMPKLIEPGTSGSQVRATPSVSAAVLEKAPAMVTISYPSRVSGSALAIVEGQYNALKLGFNAPYGERTNSRALQMSLLRSSYVAHELFRKLAQIVPKDSIILRPGTISLKDGKLTYELDGVATPSVLRVDVMEYVAPKTFWGLPQAGSRGIVVSPLFEVAVSSGSSQQRRVAVSAPLAASHLQDPSVFDGLLNLQAASRNANAQTGLKQIAWVEALPSDTLWNAHVSSKAEHRPIYGEVTFQGLVEVARDILSSDSWQSEYASAEQAYFEAFRKDVRATGGQPNPATDTAILRLFLAAEVQVASRLGFAALDALFEGSWGSALRASLSAETEVYKGMAAAIRRSALAPASDLSGALRNIALTEKQAAELGSTYDAAYSPTLAKAVTVEVSVRGASQAISAKSIKELRQRFVEIYIQSGR